MSGIQVSERVVGLFGRCCLLFGLVEFLPQRGQVALFASQLLLVECLIASFFFEDCEIIKLVGKSILIARSKVHSLELLGQLIDASGLLDDQVGALLIRVAQRGNGHIFSLASVVELLDCHVFLLTIDGELVDNPRFAATFVGELVNFVLLLAAFSVECNDRVLFVAAIVGELLDCLLFASAIAGEFQDAFGVECDACLQLVNVALLDVCGRRAVCEVETREEFVDYGAALRTFADRVESIPAQPAYDALLVEDVAALASRYRIARLEKLHANYALNFHFTEDFFCFFFTFLFVVFFVVV